ncbi:MAG: hypothetical protein JWN76_2046 [Chitinophagaceae bacterium]|nr:hypothetical protein [Chitinophagaceae bacterium]
MRFVSILLFVLVTNFCFAQNDDYPDYRSKKEWFSKIYDATEIKRDLASFAFAAIDESAGKLPLRSIPLVADAFNFLTFEGDGIKVKITTGNFDASKHKLNYYGNPDNNQKYLVRIDNKPFYGAYGTVPKISIDNITVVIDHDSIAIPQQAYADIFNPSLTYSESGVEKHINDVFISPDKRRIYIYMIKRDDKGSYEVTWVIQDKKYLRRVLDYGFMK